VTGRRSAVSPYLLRHIPRVVNDPRWGGGLSWAELAAALGGPGREHEAVFVASVWACRQRGQVEVIWHRGAGYVVAPVPDQGGTDGLHEPRRRGGH
jgi:hypothetical protein